MNGVAQKLALAIHYPNPVVPCLNIGREYGNDAARVMERVPVLGRALRVGVPCVLECIDAVHKHVLSEGAVFPQKDVYIASCRPFCEVYEDRVRD